MSDWMITPASGPLGFPVARHRHPNGTMDAVRDRTPTVVQPLGGRRSERWTYACACGEIFTWERPSAEAAGTPPPGSGPTG